MVAAHLCACLLLTAEAFVRGGAASHGAGRWPRGRRAAPQVMVRSPAADVGGMIARGPGLAHVIAVGALAARAAAPGPDRTRPCAPS